MLLLLVFGTIALSAALIVREIYSAKERAIIRATFERLQISNNETRAQLGRTMEDLHVLQSILAERHIIDELELIRARSRFIENPRRAAQEREQIAKTTNDARTPIIVDGDSTKVH